MLRAAGFWWPRVTGLHHWEEGKRVGALGIFNHVSYCDAFAIVWALCPAGLTFAFTKDIPVLGKGIRALQVGACWVGVRAEFSHLKVKKEFEGHPGFGVLVCM